MTAIATRPPSPLRQGLIVIDGSDGIAAAMADLLGSLGARIELGTDAADAAELAARGAEAGARPDLVVMTGAGWPRAARWLTWRTLGVPHLLIDGTAHRVEIGPLVVPGSPCLRCLELHRDAKAAALRRPGGEPPADELLATIAAGMAALVARSLVVDRRYLPGVVLELTLPDPRPRLRRWTVHPRCDGHSGRVTMTA